jgi:Rieske 2Fe-2S family protein
MNVVPDHVIIQRMFPVAAGHRIVECDWLYLTSVVKSGKNVTARVELVHRVNQQDLDRANAATSHGIKDLGEGRGTVPSEHHISAFHDWIQEFVGDVIPTR